MKTLTLAFAAILIFASCQEKETVEWKQRAENNYNLLGTYAIDSIQVGNGPRIDVRKEPKLQDDRYIFSWDNGIWNGVRDQGTLAYWDTLYVPRLQYFQWNIHPESNTTTSFNMGGNETIADVGRYKTKLIEYPDPAKPGEQWQIIWLAKISN